MTAWTETPLLYGFLKVCVWILNTVIENPSWSWRLNYLGNYVSNVVKVKAKWASESHTVPKYCTHPTMSDGVTHLKSLCVS